MMLVNRIARSLPFTILMCVWIVATVFSVIFLGFSLLGVHVWTQAISGIIGVMGMQAVGWILGRYSEVQRAIKS